MNDEQLREKKKEEENKNHTGKLKIPVSGHSDKKELKIPFPVDLWSFPLIQKEN